MINHLINCLKARVRQRDDEAMVESETGRIHFFFLYPRVLRPLIVPSDVTALSGLVFNNCDLSSAVSR